MRLSFTAIILIIIIFAPAYGDTLKSMETASNLGNVIASEEFCGLYFKQDAIRIFIEKSIDSSDMGFPSMLNTMILGTKYQFNEMSKSQKTAHCAQVSRIAQKYGFVD
jgi:hypothetical protein